MRFRAAAWLFALGAWIAAGSVQAEVVRLQTLESRAITYRASMAVEQARIAGARAGEDVARSAYYPKVNLNLEGSASAGGKLVRVADVHGNEYLVQGARPLGESNAFAPQLRYGATLSLLQNVYDFGRTRSAVRAAQATTDAARVDAEAARSQILAEVRAAYLSWLAASVSAQAAEDSVTQAKARRDRVDARVAEGVRPQADALLAQRQQALAELDGVRARARLKGARIEVEHASGAELGPSAEPDLELLDHPPTELGNAVTQAAVARRQAQAARATAALHEHAGGPVITASIDAGIRGANDTLLPNFHIGAAFSMPLWDGGAESGRARAANAQADEAMARSRELEAALAQQRALAQSDLQSAAERLRIAEQLFALAEQQLRGAEEKYQTGVGTLDPVLEAESEMWRAGQEVLSAKLLRIDATLRLASPGTPSAVGP
jgi:outer membrane protein TolC